ncbi:MAG TPA: hypothetical protein VNV65_04995 [Candidatus Solibacter sp.]|jgi:hypothetical protein|nr:hypothetical protein [Candidatus Solibacter sp.]
MRRLDVQRLLLLVFLGVMLVSAAVAAAQPRNLDTDIWWHLANGRYILGHGIPSTDVYSFTAVGHTWVVHEWLADVAMYLAYGAVGISGLIVLAALVVAAGELVILRLLRAGGLGPTSAVAVGVLLAVASAPSWGPRPQLLNFVFTALLTLALLAYRRRPGRWLLWLPAMFVLWANLHSGFVVGVALVLVFWVGELAQARLSRLASGRPEGVPVLGRDELRRLLLVAVGGLLAGLLTPGTYRTVSFALGTLTSQRIQSLIVEWASPDFHSISGQALLLVLLLMIAGAIGMGRSAARIDATYLLLGLAGLTLGLTSQRHVPIFAACGAPLVGQLVSSLLAGLGARPRVLRQPSAAAARINLSIAAVLLVAGVAYTWNAVSPAAVDRAVAASAPTEATDYLLSHRPPGQLFNTYNFGGYLDWTAYPTYRVFIDGRTEVYGDAVFDQYLSVEFLSGGFESTLDHYGVNTVMISASDPLRLLLEARGWRRVHSDNVALVYVRAGA